MFGLLDESSPYFAPGYTTNSLTTGARVGWERSEGFEGEEDFPAASSACNQVTS